MFEQTYGRFVGSIKVMPCFQMNEIVTKKIKIKIPNQ